MARTEFLPWEEIKTTVRPGWKVTGLFPAGLSLDERGKVVQEYSERTGTVVIAPSRIDAVDWFVLNMGGRYGNPKCVSQDNFVKARRDGRCIKVPK